MSNPRFSALIGLILSLSLAACEGTERSGRRSYPVRKTAAERIEQCRPELARSLAAQAREHLKSVAAGGTLPWLPQVLAHQGLPRLLEAAALALLQHWDQGAAARDARDRGDETSAHLRRAHARCDRDAKCEAYAACMAREMPLDAWRQELLRHLESEARSLLAGSKERAAEAVAQTKLDLQAGVDVRGPLPLGPLPVDPRVVHIGRRLGSSERMQVAFRSCYLEALAVEPDLGGTLELRLGPAPAGGGEILGGTFRRTGLEDCLLAALEVKRRRGASKAAPARASGGGPVLTLRFRSARSVPPDDPAWSIGGGGPQRLLVLSEQTLRRVRVGKEGPVQELSMDLSSHLKASPERIVLGSGGEVLVQAKEALLALDSRAVPKKVWTPAPGRHLGAVALHGDHVLIGGNGALVLLDRSFRKVSETHLGLDQPNKEAHDILVRGDDALLLDNIAYPIFMFRVDISDPRQPKLSQSIRVVDVYPHLLFQWVDEELGRWAVVKAAGGRCGERQSVLLLDAKKPVPGATHQPTPAPAPSPAPRKHDPGFPFSRRDSAVLGELELAPHTGCRSRGGAQPPAQAGSRLRFAAGLSSPPHWVLGESGGEQEQGGLHLGRIVFGKGREVRLVSKLALPGQVESHGRSTEARGVLAARGELIAAARQDRLWVLRASPSGAPKLEHSLTLRVPITHMVFAP
ncbi:MAG: hypothetical protein RBU30_18885 [Polyangia bacterium]|jgi:hypothetical protein|nr:hypothetical protein [Polyangia bacterium]